LSAKNLAFRRNVASIAKLKSPERKILYNEWFTIIKKMEKDPKFDLEALVRTRGRFTEHDHISYRDKLIEKQHQRLRCAQSEPNFCSVAYLNKQNLNDGGGGGGGLCAENMMSNSKKNDRGGINTAPAVNRGNRAGKEMTSSNEIFIEKKLKRNFSENAHDFGHGGHMMVNQSSLGGGQTTANKDLKRGGAGLVKSDSFSDNNSNNINNMGRGVVHAPVQLESDACSVNSCSRQANNKQEDQNSAASLSTALKLTLQKSDINYIKEILKKKDKNAISEIGIMNLALK
jgi:hypothetical protein